MGKGTGGEPIDRRTGIREEGEIGTLGHNGIPTTHGRRVTEMRSEFLCHGARNHARMDEEREREREEREGIRDSLYNYSTTGCRFPRARAGCVDASASKGTNVPSTPKSTL